GPAGHDTHRDDEPEEGVREAAVPPFGLEGPRRDAVLDPGAPAGLVRDAPPRGRGGAEEGLEVVARDLAGSVPAHAGAQATRVEGRRHAREFGRAHAGALEDDEGEATEQ